MKRDFDQTWNPILPLVDALRNQLSPRAARWIVIAWLASVVVAVAAIVVASLS